MVNIDQKILHQEANGFRGGVLGYTVFKRTYAAPLQKDENLADPGVLDERSASSSPRENSPIELESFEQCVRRMMESRLITDLCNFPPKDRELLRQYLLEQKCSLSGRCLQNLGTKNGPVDKHGFVPLSSCAVTTVSEPVRPFIYTAKLSLLGVGVGYSVEHKYVDLLPTVKKVRPVRLDNSQADFVVPDSRQGWMELFESLLSAYFGVPPPNESTGSTPMATNARSPQDKETFSYSFQLLSKSGSQADIAGLEQAVRNVAQVMGPRTDQKARPIDCLDLMNIIAPAVCLGQTRRAALLAIGDATDPEFLKSKRWDLGNLPLWRSASNNSVACSDIASLPESFWEGYKGNGEAMGLVNLDLIRSTGRLGDTHYPDPDICGVSACAEQALANEEVSCLAEIMLPHFRSPDELWEATRLVYSVCKNTFLLDAAEFPQTTKTVRDNFRMGIGVTGYMQASEEQKSWLPKNYDLLRAYDKIYSEKRGLPASIKLTTIKPSGTVSLLTGNTPGCHPGYSRYYIRRIRFNRHCPLLDHCRKAGLHIEDELGFDGKPSPSGRQVVEFPCSLAPETQLAEETSAIQQLEVVRRLQEDWSDSAVSVTVYYKLEELEEIRKWLDQHYSSGIKACSFLLHCDHGFVQAPYEKVEQERYLELTRSP